MRNNINPEEISILIVDDEASIRDSLKKWFKLDRYYTDSAEDAYTALTKLKERSWDIILIDIRMPGIDGFELQKRIKSYDRNIITIIITGFSSVQKGIRAMDEGAFDYIVKPLDPDEIRHIVSTAVEQRMLYLNIIRGVATK